MDKRATVELLPRAAQAVGRGHPWVYREGLAKPPSGEAGAIVRMTAGGKELGAALLDPSGPLALRVLALGPTRVDDAWVEAKVRSAAGRRTRLFDDRTTAYRVVNGEGDGLPGVVIDRYGDVAVVRTDGAAPRAFASRHEAAIVRALGLATVLHRDPRGETNEVVALRGEVPLPFVVHEHGMAMQVDLAHGQKTGAFLDQREHRLRVRGLAKGKRVLNLCSYQGGFSVAAALGGASHTTSVDVAAAAHDVAKASFRENGLDPDAHAFVASDVFDLLARKAARRDVWDLVICDPPSFAPSEKAKPRALDAYRRLHAAAVRVLAPDGLLCAASCSSHVTMPDFLSTLDVASVGTTLTVLGTSGQPADHPTTPAWVEGRYLKWVELARG